MFRRREGGGDDDPQEGVGHREPDRERPEVLPVDLAGGRDRAADEEGGALPDQDVAGGGVLPRRMSRANFAIDQRPFRRRAITWNVSPAMSPSGAIVTFPPYFFPARR